MSDFEPDTEYDVEGAMFALGLPEEDYNPDTDDSDSDYHSSCEEEENRLARLEWEHQEKEKLEEARKEEERKEAAKRRYVSACDYCSYSVLEEEDPSCQVSKKFKTPTFYEDDAAFPWTLFKTRWERSKNPPSQGLAEEVLEFYQKYHPQHKENIETRKEEGRRATFDNARSELASLLFSSVRDNTPERLIIQNVVGEFLLKNVCVAQSLINFFLLDKKKGWTWDNNNPDYAVKMLTLFVENDCRDIDVDITLAPIIDKVNIFNLFELVDLLCGKSWYSRPKYVYEYSFWSMRLSRSVPVRVSLFEYLCYKTTDKNLDDDYTLVKNFHADRFSTRRVCPPAPLKPNVKLYLYWARKYTTSVFSRLPREILRVIWGFCNEPTWLPPIPMRVHPSIYASLESFAAARRKKRKNSPHLKNN
jgi:hypothetical protein